MRPEPHPCFVGDGDCRPLCQPSVPTRGADGAGRVEGRVKRNGGGGKACSPPGSRSGPPAMMDGAPAACSVAALRHPPTPLQAIRDHQGPRSTSFRCFRCETPSGRAVAPEVRMGAVRTRNKLQAEGGIVRC